MRRSPSLRIAFTLLILSVSVLLVFAKNSCPCRRRNQNHEENDEEGNHHHHHNNVQSAHARHRTPTKVFILAGQSNQVGMGSVEHLTALVHDPDTKKEYKHLWNKTSSDWAERDDVYITFDGRKGKLTVGYGDTWQVPKFGPELEFGWVVGDALCACDNDPILILKIAWGGKDIAVDFRPPSSGRGHYDDVEPSKYGFEYRHMMDDIRTGLERIGPALIPGYNEEIGYELLGFVWFQGWNDFIRDDKVQEYEFNLANLIRDVREELRVPDLPVIIGEFGMHGIDPPEIPGRPIVLKHVLAMREAQKNVAEMEEFRDNTVYVPTSPYVVLDENATHYNEQYHYFGRADTYCKIGRAFGEAMLDLMQKNQKRRRRSLRIHQ